LGDLIHQNDTSRAGTNALLMVRQEVTLLAGTVSNLLLISFLKDRPSIHSSKETYLWYNAGESVADKFDKFLQKILFPSPIASGSALPILISRQIPTPSAVAEVKHDCVAEHSYQDKTDSQSDPKSDPSLGEIRGVSTSDRSASVAEQIRNRRGYERNIIDHPANTEAEPET
jgi:hypothetical protein